MARRVWLIAALSSALCACAEFSRRDETVRPDYERSPDPPRYNRAWGRAGVFVFGDKYVDLRNGYTTVSSQGDFIWDCSTRGFWCLYGGVSFAFPKRCRAFEVGDAYVLRGVAMTVRAIVEWPRRDHHGPSTRSRRVYIVQSDTTDFLDRPQRQFFAYSQNIEWVSGRSPAELLTLERVFDGETGDIISPYWAGPRRSLEPMAQCLEPEDDQDDAPVGS